jgi:hypothetical protein
MLRKSFKEEVVAPKVMTPAYKIFKALLGSYLDIESRGANYGTNMREVTSQETNTHYEVHFISDYKEELISRVHKETTVTDSNFYLKVTHDTNGQVSGQYYLKNENGEFKRLINEKKQTAAEQFAMLRKKLSEAEQTDGGSGGLDQYITAVSATSLTKNSFKNKIKEIKEIYINNDPNEFEKILRAFSGELETGLHLQHTPNTNPFPNNFGTLIVSCVSEYNTEFFITENLDVVAISKMLNDKPRGNTGFSIDAALADPKLEKAVKTCYYILSEFHTKLKNSSLNQKPGLLDAQPPARGTYGR